MTLVFSAGIWSESRSTYYNPTNMAEMQREELLLVMFLTTSNTIAGGDYQVDTEPCDNGFSQRTQN